MQPEPNGKPRLSAEMMATGDALRHIVLQVSALQDAQNPAVHDQPATAILLTEGPDVVLALEDLAGRIGIVQ